MGIQRFTEGDPEVYRGRSRGLLRGIQRFTEGDP